MVYNNKRRELVDQTIETLKNNTPKQYVLYADEDTVGNFKSDSLNYLKVKNKLVQNIPFNWEYIIFTDDDLFFSEGWLKTMIKAITANSDIWIVAGTTWPTHERIDKRKDVTISDIVCGGCWIMKREVWDKCGPFAVDRRKTFKFVDKVKGIGGKIAILNDKLMIVHW